MSTIKVQNIQHTASSTNAIALASDGTCTANITNNLSNRNLIINGAMQVAQRGTSSTSSGYGSVDRFSIYYNSADEAPTQAQADVASGTTPYTLGFRKAFKLTNGNQTSVGTLDILWIQHTIEAQDIANSGWNYTDTNSFITLSFWIKSSVAQTFKGYIRTLDGSSQQYPFETGSLTANTWTKITKVIPGNSNLTFDNDNGGGLQINIVAFYGTSGTSSSVTENAWGAYNSSARMKDNTSTWWTTNDATLEITGVQLEVGSVATDFEHRSYAQELDLCKRYFQVILDHYSGTGSILLGIAAAYSTTQGEIVHRMEKEMRATPSLEASSGTNFYEFSQTGSNATHANTFSSFAFNNKSGLLFNNSMSGLVVGRAYRVLSNANGAYLKLNAEL